MLLEILERTDLIFELYLFMHLYSSRFPRKKNYISHLVLGAILAFFLNLICFSIFRTMWGSIVVVISCIAYCFFWHRVCYDVHAEWTGLSVVAAYISQNITYSIYLILLQISGIGFQDSVVAEGRDGLIGSAFFSMASFSLPRTIVYLLTVVLMAVILERMFARRVFQNGELLIDRKIEAAMLVIAFLMDTVFKFYMVDNDLGANAGLVFVAWKTVTNVCLVLLLAMITWTIDRSREMTERQNLENILIDRQRQYEISKENLDMLRVRLHDLKHMLNRRDALTDEELEAELNDFLAVARTGNEVLDTILSQKSLRCRQLGITFEYIIDGTDFDKISTGELSSLFGNMLDNAIEAVSQVKDKDRRVIHLTARIDNGLCTIHEENYFEGKLTYENGQLATSKADSFFHGLGTRSIRMIVEQHDGTMEISAERNVFNMNLLFFI